MLTFPFLVPDSAQKRKKAEVLTQDPLYDKESNPSRLFCSYVSDTSARTYALFKSKENMLEKITKRDITTWFAIIEADTPLSMYMDIEMPRHNGYTCDFLKNAQMLVRWFISFICAEYNYLCLGLSWYFFDATTDEKYSIHVHCPDLAFQSVAQLNLVMKRFQMLLLLFRQAFSTRFAPFFYKRDKEEECILDFRVYNRNRNMRMPYQEKRKGKRNFLLPVYPPDLETMRFQDQVSIGLPQPIPYAAHVLGPLQTLGERLYEQTGLADTKMKDESFLEAWFTTLIKPPIAYCLSSSPVPFKEAQMASVHSCGFQGEEMERLYTLMKQELQTKLVSFPRLSDVCARRAKDDQAMKEDIQPPPGFVSMA